MPQPVAGGENTPLQRARLVIANCLVQPYGLPILLGAGVIGLVAGALIGGLLVIASVLAVAFVIFAGEMALMGNPWPAFMLVNIIGIGVPLAIRWRNKRRRAATISKGRE